MHVINSSSKIKSLNLPNIVCSIGVFDGIHRGHQRIIDTIIRRAKRINGTSMIITFSNHPYTMLKPSVHIPILTPLDYKLFLLKKSGIDTVLLLDFNKDLAGVTAEQWIKDILCSQIRINSILISEKTYFGKDRHGNAGLLKKWSGRLGFSAVILKPLKINKTPVSSTFIRNLILHGRIKSADRHLNRPYSVFGRVISGTGRGRTLGFPTANLLTHDQCVPNAGVYAAMARIRKNKNDFVSFKNNLFIPAAVNIGLRPTFNELDKMFEVHLLGDTGNLYNKEMEIVFIKKLRNEKKFPNEAALIKQIKKDIEQTKKITAVFCHTAASKRENIWIKKFSV